jgi:hypothetical protein
MENIKINSLIIIAILLIQAIYFVVYYMTFKEFSLGDQDYDEPTNANI